MATKLPRTCKAKCPVHDVVYCSFHGDVATSKGALFVCPLPVYVNTTLGLGTGVAVGVGIGAAVGVGAVVGVGVGVGVSVAVGTGV